MTKEELRIKRKEYDKRYKDNIKKMPRIYNARKKIKYQKDREYILAHPEKAKVYNARAYEKIKINRDFKRVESKINSLMLLDLY